MMSVKVTDLQINPRIVRAATRAGLHDGRAVLSLSGAELERLTGLSSSDCTQLKDAVAETVVGCHLVTGLQMWKEEVTKQKSLPKLSAGCDQLDKALRGGVLVRGITEVSGESAAGKTQLCLQLCLTVQLPLTHGGLNGGAVYICTEGAFPNKRLNQMVQHFCQRYSSVIKHRVTDRILLEHVADLDGLKECLQRKLPVACARGRVKLVVVDSVAALFRCHYERQNLVGRAKHLASVAAQLRQLADQHNTAVVCVNQVSANMSKASDGPASPRQCVPALGLVWADHVTCRLLMSRQDTLSTSVQESCVGVREAEEGVSKRLLEVVFAPHLPQTVVSLSIDHSGIRHGNSDE